MNTEVMEQPNQITIAANKITDGLAAFEQRKAELIELKKEAEGLNISSIEDKVSINQVITIRKRLKVARVQIEKEGKSMRDPLTVISREISAKEKELIAIIEPTEKELQKQEDWVESEKERIRQEAEAKEKARIQNRIDRLAQYGYSIDYNMLVGLSDEDFDGVVDNAKYEYEKEQARKAEEERLRLAAEAKAQLEREQEAARLRAEREELEKLRKEQQERELKFQLEQEKMEAEKVKLAQERFDRRVKSIRALGMKQTPFSSSTDFAFGRVAIDTDDIENWSDEKFERFLVDSEQEISQIKEELRIREEEEAKERETAEKLRVERLQKEAAEKALRDKEEADRRKKEEEIEKLAQASDKAKFQDLYNQLKLIAIPEMKSVRSKKIATEVADIITNAQMHIQNNILKSRQTATA